MIRPMLASSNNGHRLVKSPQTLEFHGLLKIAIVPLEAEV